MRCRHNFSVTQISANTKARKSSTPGQVPAISPGQNTASDEPTARVSDDEEAIGAVLVAVPTRGGIDAHSEDKANPDGEKGAQNACESGGSEASDVDNHV